MASGATPSQSGSAWLAAVSSGALAKEDDVGDDGGAFPLEGVGRQSDRADEIRLRRQVFADGGILLVEREVGGDQRQHAAGLERVDRLGEEEVVQRMFLPAIVELEVGEGHVADDRVHAAFRQARVTEVLDPDVLPGMQCLGDAAGDQVQLDADEAHPARGQAHEIARAQPGSRTVAVGGDTQAADGLVHRRDDVRGGVEGVERRGTPSTGPYSSGVRSSVVSSSPRACHAAVLVAAAHRVGERSRGRQARSPRSGRACISPPSWQPAAPARWS